MGRKINKREVAGKQVGTIRQGRGENREIDSIHTDPALSGVKGTTYLIINTTDCKQVYIRLLPSVLIELMKAFIESVHPVLIGSDDELQELFTKALSACEKDAKAVVKLVRERIYGTDRVNPENQS